MYNNVTSYHKKGATIFPLNAFSLEHVKSIVLMLTFCL